MSSGIGWANQEQSDVEIKELEQQLVELTEEKQRVYADKEKQKILSNCVLRKEMQNNLEDAQGMLVDMKTKEIEATKKLSILQNIQLCIELEQQSNRIDVLLNDNDRLQADISKLSMEIETYKYVEDSFTKKAAENQREVLRLTDTQTDFTDEYEKLKAEIKGIKKGGLMRTSAAREGCQGHRPG